MQIIEISPEKKISSREFRIIYTYSPFNWSWFVFADQLTEVIWVIKRAIREKN